MESIKFFPQVGINTASPETTLEVAGKAEDINHYDGILPPRLTGDQLSKKVYSSSKKGTVVFVTAPPKDLSGQVTNVTEAGLYYFDGTLWEGLSNNRQNIEYRVILTFESSNDDVLTAASKWSEPINLWNDTNVCLTSTKFYTLGTKNFGGLKGSVIFKKIGGIINIKIQMAREPDSANVVEDVKMDISDICNEIGYFPTDIAFLHTEENPTFILPIYFQNNSIYIPSGNFNFISSDLIGGFQGYSSWIKPHLK